MEVISLQRLCFVNLWEVSLNFSVLNEVNEQNIKFSFISVFVCKDQLVCQRLISTMFIMLLDGRCQSVLCHSSALDGPG